MNKKEIKYYLQVLRKNNHLKKNKENIYQVNIYKRYKEMKIPEWAFKIFDYLEEIINLTQDILIKEIVKMHYFNNFSDLEIISKLPISETLYYKYKRKIEDNIYHLLICEGYITKEDIKKEVIEYGNTN